jgi:hypothetical protein
VGWGVRGELDSWAEPWDLAGYARLWFELAADGLLAGLLHDLRTGPALSSHVFGIGSRPDPWGEPDGLWASVPRFDRPGGNPLRGDAVRFDRQGLPH